MRCSIAFGLAIMLAGTSLSGAIAAPANSNSMIAVQPSSAKISTPVSETALGRLGTLIGGLHNVGSYVSSVTRDARNVSPHEIAVASQYRCLAQAVYFEARGEPKDGQKAIAHVVLNRVRDGRYPSTICGVVYQNQNMANRCQFSFACDGKSDRPNDKWAWRQSLKVALDVLTGASQDITRASTHFHAQSVEPVWSTSLKQTIKVGQHVFYQEPRTRYVQLSRK